MIIAIIGGGCSGVMLAMQLYRAALKPLRIVLFEKSFDQALGVAYSTQIEAHLLNVPAQNMSAFADKPNDFIDWIKENHLPLETFMPRRIYGQYLQARFQKCLAHASIHGAVIEVQTQEVIAMHANTLSQWAIETKQGFFQADKAVLATGHLLPRAQFSHLPPSYIIQNPWDASRLNAIAPSDTVLILGTGLTMVDVVLSLKKNGHRGLIYAISRRGLLPYRHESVSSCDLSKTILPQKLLPLMQHIRQIIKNNPLVHWQAVLHALRPLSQHLWKNFSYNDKRRFLRHLLPFWNVHRHRLPASVADIMQKLQDENQLKIIGGNILSVSLNEQAMLAKVKLRNCTTEPLSITANVLINCTGPNGHYSQGQSPLFKQLLTDNYIREDNLQLGLDVTAYGALINQSGDVTKNLFALGSLCKGHSWEITAVPDIRQQCQQLAQLLNASSISQTKEQQIPIILENTN
jgi:uncharacterized NAD(P)/FAD-binding protein YdhS